MKQVLWFVLFRMMKTEFEARPVFLQRGDRIEAHFLTCFLALLLYKYLEKKLNRGNHFTPDQIITKQRIRSIVSLTEIAFTAIWGCVFL